MGNYLYCSACVCAALGVSQKRVARQRRIKTQMYQHPVVEMTKLQVEKQRLGEYIVMPDGVEASFKLWWRSLSDSTVVNVDFHMQSMVILGRYRTQQREQ